jgi:hypothetical protein
MLGWLVSECAIEPDIPVFDKSARDDGTFSREDFAYNQEVRFRKLAGRDRLRIIKVMFPSLDGREANVVQSSGMQGRQHLGRREWH